MPEVSVVMPCLNEEETLGICIQKANDTIQKLGLDAEVVISDNGSTDRSVEIAESLPRTATGKILKRTLRDEAEPAAA